MRSQFLVVALLIVLGIGIGYGVSFVYHPYKQQIASLNNTIQKLKLNLTNLTKKYTSLLGEYHKLQNNYAQLEQSYDRLSKSFENLRTEYHKLETDYQSLQQQYNDLQTRYNDLKNDYDTLQNNYNQLQQDYNSLQVQYNQLQSNYNTLQTQYNQLQADYNDVTDKYGYFRYRVGTLVDMISNPFYYVLNEDDPTVFNKAIEVVGHGWNSTTWYNDIVTIYRWVSNPANVPQRQDPKVPYPDILLYDKDGNYVTHINNLEGDNQKILQTVNETYWKADMSITIAREWTFYPSDVLVYGGDCDDHAVLLADMWEGYCQGNCETGVVSVILTTTAGTSYGHIATYAKVTVNGNIYYVICDSTHYPGVSDVCSAPSATLEDAALEYAQAMCQNYNTTYTKVTVTGYHGETYGWNYFATPIEVACS